MLRDFHIPAGAIHGTGSDPQCCGQAKNSKDDDALASVGYREHHRFM